MLSRLKHRMRDYRQRRRARHHIATYLRNADPVCIALGAGASQRDGWLATDVWPRAPDVVALDIRHRFPFPDNSIDYFVAEHVIEHVTLDQGLAMLRECRRCLNPGGRVRIATPDLLRFADFLNTEPSADSMAYINWINGIFGTPLEGVMPSPGVIAINRAFRKWGHKFLYDPASLQKLLEMAGFTDIGFHAVGESADPHLQGIEDRALNPRWADGNAFETMVIEAAKPRSA